MKLKTLIKTSLLLLFILFATLQNNAQDGFPYDKYKPRTLGEMIEINSDIKKADVTMEKAGKLQMTLNADPLYSQVRVKFMNQSRPISTERKDLIKIWQTTFNADERVLTLYENEYLFKECETEYWIPVQKQVASYFPKELKTGDMLSLFIMRVGGRKEKENWDWLFLTNEFIK